MMDRKHLLILNCLAILRRFNAQHAVEHYRASSDQPTRLLKPSWFFKTFRALLSISVANSAPERYRDKK